MLGLTVSLTCIHAYFTLHLVFLAVTSPLPWVQDFSSYVSNWANGLRLQTNVGGQDTVGQAILFQGTANNAGVRDPLPVPGHFPIASLAYAAVVATAPMPYDELLTILKPGDFLAISGGGPSQPPTHVVMYLGKAGLGAGVGVGSDYPLILDSTDTQFAPDQNGCLAPPGPHLVSRSCHRPCTASRCTAL